MSRSRPIHRARALRIAALLSALLSAGCSASSSAPTDAAATPDVAPDAVSADTSADVVSADAPVDGAAMARCTATTVPCQDESIQSLGLFDTVNAAAITQVSADNGVFVHEVDATGGGMTPTRAYVYARFTADGLEKVSISDEDALTSLDWDVAFRRFIIRVNSGVSGPSCVQAARTAPGTTFDALTAVPATLSYRTEAYLTPSCDLVPDGSGLGSPSTALSSFWTYSGCVHMSGNVYVVRLRDGRAVKLQVLSYYSPTAQAQCDAMDTLPATSGAGHVRVRWAPLGG